MNSVIRSALITFFLIVAFVPHFQSHAVTDTRGRILLQVESVGEAWYVNPADGRRYYMRDGSAAYELLRTFGLGISNDDLSRIPVEGSGVAGDAALAKRLSGRILLQVHSLGEAWYVDPVRRERVYLRDGAAAYELMRRRGLGITNRDLSAIPSAYIGDIVKARAVIQYQHQSITVAGITYKLHILKVNLNDPALRILTDTASAADCTTNCPVKSLLEYVEGAGAFAGVNGSYFCPSAYPDCQGKVNYYYYPVFNSQKATMINAGQIRYPTTGSLMVVDDKNKVYFLKNVNEFRSVSEFEKSHGAKVRAAIGNSPLLRFNGSTVLDASKLDTNQATVKSARALVGLMGATLYAVAASGATVIDMASIATTLGLDYALNLDGGGSTAMYYDGSYKVGPGRNIPNALLFQVR